MKKHFTLVLLTLALLCALTGCGGRKEPAGNNANGDTTVTNPDNSNGGNGLVGDVENGVNDVGDAIMSGADRVEDGLTGDNTANGNTNGTVNGGTSGTTNGATSGVPYDEMMRNARVHDGDGILTDGENAVSRNGNW
ncbi:MAG: hypothetical protein PUC45_08860 [Oscillospiraceae bacterium]|nr:hypothetical protein [Oscillospiraceae bacterium]